MRQVIEWKEIDESMQYRVAYYFKAKEVHDIPTIIQGDANYYDGKHVNISIDNVHITLPLNYFTHYAEVE